MGQTSQLVQKAAFMAHQKLLWRQNWTLFRMAWILHKNAYFPIHHGCYLLHFRRSDHFQPIKPNKVKTFLTYTDTQNHHNCYSIEICDDNYTSNLQICPECDSYCTYTDLVNSCFLSRITYLFDNYSTVLWSIFMTVWATTYLEMWKRRQAILKWEWDLSDNEDVEEIRPQFEANVKSRR